MTDRPNRARFALDYPNERPAAIVEASLAPEVGDIDDDRSRAAVSRDGSTVLLVVEAADLVALRAAGNTWLSLADAAERTVAIAE